jgi:hypothetical protein
MSKGTRTLGHSHHADGLESSLGSIAMLMTEVGHGTLECLPGYQRSGPGKWQGSRATEATSGYASARAPALGNQSPELWLVMILVGLHPALALT